MSIEVGRVVLLLLFIAAANLPFFTQRIFGLVPLRRETKPFFIILAEWLVLFALMGGISALIETRLYGSLYPQGGHFYFIGLFLFAVFAFPGYVFRYLLGRTHKGGRQTPAR
ncbi:DUF2818 family protein [Uliginosibacterium sp. sgz301328]|uniref:DUF2818 family protein n=1 Tax=Uliginosibacterium sp. sgz301328 TaxID=3243764 RepID=UPI00359EA10E